MEYIRFRVHGSGVQGSVHGSGFMVPNLELDAEPMNSEPNHEP
jgi:hypothetical protein